MVEWKWKESRECLQLDSAISLSISVSSAFCYRIHWGQNMRSSGESSQRSCSRRNSSFENTSPPPRITKDGRALPIHAARNISLHLKAQGICITGKCTTCRSSGWRHRYLEVTPWWSLSFISSFGGERNTLGIQSFLIGDSKKEYLPIRAIWLSYTFLSI